MIVSSPPIGLVWLSIDKSIDTWIDTWIVVAALMR
jgi:hypothetical protein